MEEPILTIAVPIYNMDRWLKKNLATYDDPRLAGRLEVLCLNNASTDRSKEIAQWYERKCPEIFALIDRSSRGYGGSINEGIQRARGAFFRIVDADDWVDTEELVKLVDALKDCEADIVLTDYQIVNMQNGEHTKVAASRKEIPYYQMFHDWDACVKLSPSIHSTTYRASLLRESGFYMQDNLFFVDEEYVILPYLYAKTSICYPFDVYRYQVANPAQSTSPKNRAKFQAHREAILKRLIHAYRKAEAETPQNPALPYCYERICRGIGDHFTTLYIYEENRGEGRRLAKDWQEYVSGEFPKAWQAVKGKAGVLRILNRCGVSLAFYEKLKRAMGINRQKKWDGEK